jgi:hypothetical protein
MFSNQIIDSFVVLQGSMHASGHWIRMGRRHTISRNWSSIWYSQPLDFISWATWKTLCRESIIPSMLSIPLACSTFSLPSFHATKPSLPPARKKPWFHTSVISLEKLSVIIQACLTGNIPHDTEYRGAQSNSKILKARSFPLEDSMCFMHES